jgi:O-antigen/teichoic acid export membrane protein
VEGELKRETLTAIPWLALAVPIATMSGVLIGTLQGYSRFLELNVISATSSALIQTIPLIVAVAFGPNLTWLILSTIITRIVVILLLFYRCYLVVAKGSSLRFQKTCLGDY